MNNKLAKRIWFALAVVAMIIFSVFPFYYAIITSMKTGTSLFEVSYFPSSFDFTNYFSLFENQPFGRNIINSVMVAFSVVVISLIISVTASFALGRINFRGKKHILLSILCVSMFPQVAVLSGLFEMVKMFGIYNSLWSLVLAYMIFTLPFTIWVLTTFMKQLPAELEEAAIVDGCSTFTIIFKVFMPMMVPAMVTTGLLAFIAAWNEFLFALTFILSNTERTVPVAIGLISGTSQYELPWGGIMAASVIVTVPLVFLVLVFQRQIVSGLTSGAVKG